MIYAPIANTDTFVYDLSVAKTKAIGFSSLFVSRRTHRPQSIGGFFVSAPYHEVPLRAGRGGEGLGPAGFLERQSANPAICPPTSFSSGERVNNPVLGGHNMAALSIRAHSEQTHSPNTFHLAARAARKAARQWFHGIPMQTIAVWRDTCRAEHCEGLPNPKERGLAFNNAFAQEVGNLIIGGGRSHE